MFTNDEKETRSLLAANADVNAQNNEGRTPMHSCHRGHVKDLMVELLLEAGFDPTTLKDDNGETALQKAKREAPSHYRLLIRHLTREWSPERHRYYPPATRLEMFTWLLVNQRASYVDRQVSLSIILPYIAARNFVEEEEEGEK